METNRVSVIENVALSLVIFYKITVGIYFRVNYFPEKLHYNKSMRKVKMALFSKHI